MPPLSKTPLVLTILIAWITALPLHAQLPQYKPGREYRSLNTGAYEIAIQKNGRIDVALVSGAPVFLNAFPMVWFADKKEQETIRLDGRYSQRFEVNDALGRGQGMRIRYKDVQWTLRAYPTKPYLAVQLAYINSAKKPVQIKQLVPWAIGDPKKGSIALGPGTLDAAMLLDGMSAKQTPLATRNGEAPNMIALLNPNTGRSIIAGFTTQSKAFNTLHIQALDPDEEEPHQLDYMRAVNTYDPPITVQPGEVLESEILYLAITESDPLLALERYAKAVAVTNKIPNYTQPPVRNVFFPLSGEDENATHTALMETAQHIKTNSTENIRFILASPTQWSNPNNLNTLAQYAEELRAQGYLVGLAGNPFEVSIQADIVKQHPDWFIHPVDSSDAVSTVLVDISHTEARSWIAAGLRNSQKVIGFDSLWNIDLDVYSKADKFHSGDSLTKIEIIRLAMSTLRTALGNRIPVILNASELLPIFPNTHNLIDLNHTSNFFQAPHLGHHYALNTVSVYPYAALTGINLIESQETLNTAWTQNPANAVFLPPVIRPAKPQDLFFNNDPDIWLKTGNAKTGHWILAGINNNTDATKTLTLPINNPKVRQQPQFTLFDLQQKRYYGQSQTRININVPKKQMRTLLLREYKRVPLLLGTTFPISQTLPDKINERWNPTTLTLTGTLTTTQKSGTLHFLEAPGYKIQKATLNDTPIQWKRQDNTITINTQTTPNAPTTWSLTFSRN